MTLKEWMQKSKTASMKYSARFATATVCTGVLQSVSSEVPTKPYVLCWAFVGFMLGVCWAHVGSMLDRVGPMLGSMSGHVGPMLGLYWAMLSPNLAS